MLTFKAITAASVAALPIASAVRVGIGRVDWVQTLALSVLIGAAVFGVMSLIAWAMPALPFAYYRVVG